ncbi:MAG: glycosyltransferase family 2 protein [Clostridiales bacterium]|nr:glycosyltransferase family 2 protein [Clostridiales bacterium]
MEVTVIVPNYNGMKFIDTCLAALEQQSIKDFKTLVIDNGSSDGSIEFIRTKYPKVHLVERGENYGFSNAVNTGIQMADTPYVILLNNDTQVEELFVEELVKAIKKNPKCFSCSSKMLHFIERHLLDDAGDLYTVVGWQFQRGVGRLETKYNKAVKVFSACAGAAIYRRQVFEKIGYFDEGHFAYLEDIDVGYRARIYGYENMFCPSARVYHVGSGTSGSKYNEFKVKLSVRNSVYLNYKNMPILQLLINAVPLIIGYLVKWLFFIRIGFGKTYINGLKEGLNTLSNCRKVPFRWKNLKNYLKIELELIGNTFIYVYEFVMRRLMKLGEKIDKR